MSCIISATLGWVSTGFCATPFGTAPSFRLLDWRGVRSQVQRLVQDGLEALERLEDFHLAVQFLVGHTQGVRHRGMNPAVLPSAADTGSDTEGVIEPKFACFQRRHLGTICGGKLKICWQCTHL